MTKVKEHHVFFIKQIRYAAFLLVFVLLLAIFFFGKVEQSHAAWYQLTGISPGFQGASCPGTASDWVAVRGDLRDAVTGGRINGTFYVSCQYDYKSSWVDPWAGCLNVNPAGQYYCGGPHATKRYGTKCSSGSAGLMGVVCMGSCTLPFNLRADATNYAATPTWLLNNEYYFNDTLYPEGNANTANYNIYLDRAACETCSWNACSSNTRVCRDPWGNWCNTAACTANSYYCSGGNRWSRNTGCSGGACYNNANTKVQNCTPNSYYCSGGNRWSRNTGCSGGACYNNPNTKVQNCTPNTSYCVGPDLCWTNSGCSGGACYNNADTCSPDPICNLPPTVTNLNVASPPDYCFYSSPPITLNWTFSDPDPGGSQSAYRVQVDNNSGFSSPEVDSGKVLSASNSYAPLSLSFNTAYYWRVKVWDNWDAPSPWMVGLSFSTLSRPPKPDFTWAPPEPSAGEIVQFCSRFEDGVCLEEDKTLFYGASGTENWAWDFGDLTTTCSGPPLNGDCGENNNYENPTHVYSIAGLYTVTLTATDDAGSCSIPQDLTASPPLPEWREIPPTGWLKKFWASLFSFFQV